MPKLPKILYATIQSSAPTKPQIRLLAKREICFPANVMKVPSSIPVNNDENNALYDQYKKLADAEEKTVFGGRLGEYRYYDMDAVLDRALKVAGKELGGLNL